MVRPEDEVIQLHHLSRSTSAMVLDPFNTDLLTAKMLGCFKRIPSVYVSAARGVLTMVSRRVCTNALIYNPQVVLDPHCVIHNHDGGGDVRKEPEDARVVNSVLDTLCFLRNIIVFYCGILASVTQRFDRVILRKEAK